MNPKLSSEAGEGQRSVVGRVLRALLVAAVSVVCVVALSGCSNKISEAHELERQGDIEGALASYTQALEEEPDDTVALTGASVCLMLLKRYDEALLLQERLVEVDPTDAQIRVELGFNYLNHQSRPADAARVFTEAVQLEPSAKNLCFLAQAQQGAGKAADAEATLRRAIAAEPGYQYSYRLLVGFLQEQGRAEEAQQVVQQAEALGIDVNQTP